jgi:hypothetical protein
LANFEPNEWQFAYFPHFSALFPYNRVITIKGISVKGTMNITYKILCNNDTDMTISLDDLLNNEKIVKAIKSEFGKGVRNIALSSDDKAALLVLATEKELYNFEVSKNDFADLLELAEENAKGRKLFKKECDRVEIVDIETI